MKLLITLFLLTLTANHAIAEEIDPVSDLKEYDVEIIIFEDAHARYISIQTWSQSIHLTNKNIVIENTDNDIKENTANFQPIQPSILKEI
jgi:Fe-S cluster assembly scaffold protein SufB